MFQFFFINSVCLVVYKSWFGCVFFVVITNKNLLTVLVSNKMKKKIYWILYTWNVQHENVKCEKHSQHLDRKRNAKNTKFGSRCSQTLIWCVHVLWVLYIYSSITKSLSIITALICVLLTCLSLSIHQLGFIIQFFMFFFLLLLFLDSFQCFISNVIFFHNWNVFDYKRVHFQYILLLSALKFFFNTNTNRVKCECVLVWGGWMLIVCLLQK